MIYSRRQHFFQPEFPIAVAELCQIRVWIHKINAAELSLNFLLSLLFSADFHFSLFFFFLEQFLIRVTCLTFKFERQTRGCLLIPSFLVIVTEGCFRDDLWGHSFPSDTGSVELCIQMTGRVSMNHNIFTRFHLPDLSRSNKSRPGG